MGGTWEGEYCYMFNQQQAAPVGLDNTTQVKVCL